MIRVEKAHEGDAKPGRLFRGVRLGRRFSKGLEEEGAFAGVGLRGVLRQEPSVSSRRVAHLGNGGAFRALAWPASGFAALRIPTASILRSDAADKRWD